MFCMIKIFVDHKFRTEAHRGQRISSYASEMTRRQCVYRPSIGITSKVKRKVKQSFCIMQRHLVKKILHSSSVSNRYFYYHLTSSEVHFLVVTGECRGGSDECTILEVKVVIWCAIVQSTHAACSVLQSLINLHDQKNLC